MSFLGMFIRFVLAFIISVLIFYQLPEFPPLWVGIASVCLAVCLVLIVRFSPVINLIGLKSKAVQQTFWMMFNILLGLIIGMSWAFWHAFFSPTIPEAVLNQPVFITGSVIDLPNQTVTGNRIRIKYRLKVDAIAVNSDSEQPTKQDQITYSMGLKPEVVINWYLATYQFKQLIDQPKLGETWRMRVKLKANHASMNPGAFDYETWLFQQGVSAKGYIKAFTKTDPNLENLPVVELVDERSFFRLATLRHWLASRLNTLFEQSEFKQFYQALTYGDKSDISSDDWALLQSTGTIHLMAISGLHMGIIALLGFWCFKGLWWIGIYRIERINLPEFAALGAFLFATVYLTLSGFSIPTQRAWLMVVAVLAFVLIKRNFQPWSALALAAFLIVLWDPRSLLSFGFWLSFIAVALIFVTLIRPKVFESDSDSDSKHDSKNSWQSAWLEKFKLLLWIQLVLTIGLAPLLIWLFNSLPVYSFIANLIAVPFVSLLGLPVLFIASVVGLFSLETGLWMIEWLDAAWAIFWQYLEWLNQLPNRNLLVTGLNLFWVLVLYFLLFWGLKVQSSKAKLKGSLILVSMVLLMATLLLVSTVNQQRPELNQAKLTILDVGQGQAIVVETHHQVLVYDTGAKWGSSMDGAKLALVPYLKSRGWHKIDRLIVSHSDSDHAGGVLSLLKVLPVDQAISGQPKILNKTLKSYNKKLNRQKGSNQLVAIETRFSQCHNQQRWMMDGVLFEILSPTKEWMGTKLKSDNDLSCVLRVSAGDKKVLIMGDLTKRGEALLINAFESDSKETVTAGLQADLLIAGHHGSKHSTKPAWLQAVSPSKVVFSSGYLNRFNFPAKQVIERLKKQSKNSSSPSKIAWWNTACSGALSFQLTNLEIKLLEEHRKSQRKWYHHGCLEYQRGHLFQ